MTVVGVKQKKINRNHLRIIHPKAFSRRAEMLSTMVRVIGGACVSANTFHKLIPSSFNKLGEDFNNINVYINTKSENSVNTYTFILTLIAKIHTEN